MKHNGEYLPLAGDDGDEETVLSTSDEDVISEKRAIDESPALRRLAVVVICLSLLCSVVSLVLLVLNAQTQWELHNLLGLSVHRDSQYERPDPSLLERPSVYIGLDKLAPEVQHSGLPSTLDVFPPLFQPVDHIHQHYVFPTDGHARFTFNGQVSPGDHRVLLTNHVTMVAQFRVHDYGMERCRVVSAIPSWELLQSHNQTLHLAGDTSRIEVWNLTSSGELNERELSWATKPTREELITTLRVGENSTHKSDEFWCGPSGSLQTIELLCPGVGCYIELWQDYYFQPRFGIYIQQSPSI